jgi:putative flippase GtrA
MLYMLHDVMGIDHRIAQLFAIAVLVVMFFLLYKYFVFPEAASRRV